MLKAIRLLNPLPCRLILKGDTHMNMHITIDATDEELRSLNGLLDLLVEHGTYFSDICATFAPDIIEQIRPQLQVSKE